MKAPPRSRPDKGVSHAWDILGVNDFKGLQGRFCFLLGFDALPEDCSARKISNTMPGGQDWSPHRTVIVRSQRGEVKISWA